MTLEELQQAVDRDFKLDDTELDSESIQTLVYIKINLLTLKYLNQMFISIWIQMKIYNERIKRQLILIR